MQKNEYRERLIHEMMSCLQELYPDFMYNKSIQEVLDWLDESISDRKIETREVKNDKRK